MLSQLTAYIQDCAALWPLKTKVKGPLAPLLRFNKEANGVVKKEQIGTVIFWFTPLQREPVLVSKIIDTSLSIEYIEHCVKDQEKINKNIGRSVFPAIYSVVKIDSHPVIFQEAIDAPNYEMELNEVTYGPRADISTIKKLVKRHFKEMTFLFNHLKTIEVSRKTGRWGNWAYAIGQEFKNNYNLELTALSEDCLCRMKKKIDSTALQTNYVLVDHYAANYFSGPRIVDQIDKSLIKRKKEEPGIIDVLRFVIAYLRTSPLNVVYKDWLSVLALAITDNYESVAIGVSLRTMLQNVGMPLDKPAQVWSLAMVSFFLRAMDELAFHKDNHLIIPRLRKEIESLTTKLVEIQDIIESSKNYDFSFVSQCEKRFTSVSKSVFSHVQPPLLVEEGYKGFNIILYQHKFHALSQDLGSIDISNLGKEKRREYQNNSKYTVGERTDETKFLIDRLVFKDKIKLIEEGYNGFNIVLFGDKYYAISQDLSPQDLTTMDESMLINYQKSNNCFMGNTIFEVKYFLERLCCQQLQQNILDYNKKIDSLQKENSLRDENTNKFIADIAVQNKRIDDLQSNVSSCNKTIETLNDEISVRDRNIDTLSANIKELNKTIAGLRTGISARDENIVVLSANIDKCNKTIDSLRSDISARNEDIAKLKADVEKRNNSIDSLRSAVSERDESIKALNDEASKKDENIAKLNTEATETSNYVKNLIEEMADIKSKWYFRLLK